MNDKLKHFFACAAITVAVLIIFAASNIAMNGYDKMIAIAVGMAAAAGKEIVYDKWLHKGTPDFYDFTAGMYGAFAGMFAWAIVETIIQMI